MASEQQILREERPPSHKVLLIGDASVVKTCLIMRSVAAKFDPKYKMTLGVDFALKVVERPGLPHVHLQLWDISGQERFGRMLRAYYRHAIACIIVFDLTRKETFENVRGWKAELDDKVKLANGNSLPCLLLGNKCDLDARDVSRSSIQSLCDELGFIGFGETSALTNTKVEESMNLLVKTIVSIVDEESAPPSEDDILRLADGSKKGACCIF